MGGRFESPALLPDGAVLEGAVSVAAMRGYWTEVAAYTRGRGQLFCTVKGYEPCHNAEEVIASAGYDAERDTENPADSVFCTHGAGYVVPWQQVVEKAHCDSGQFRARRGEERAPVRPASGGLDEDKELLAIFERTYGSIKNRGMDALYQSRVTAARTSLDEVNYVHQDDVLIVDGYNIIFAWDELKTVAAENFDAARAALVETLCNYQGMRQCRVILVFDAYRVKGGAGSREKQAGVEIVYTKEGETADAYIERLTHELGKSYHVKVATGDGLEQLMVLGHGAQRMTSRELQWEMEQMRAQIADFLRRQG
jgi:predicted RNA-binding protein with PIN domain